MEFKQFVKVINKNFITNDKKKEAGNQYQRNSNNVSNIFQKENLTLNMPWNCIPRRLNKYRFL